MKKILLMWSCLALAQFVWAQDIALETYATGFNRPVDLKHAGDDRLFVVEQAGLIKIIDANGNTNTTPFLSLVGQVSGGNEQGLLSIAFHPDYANNGYFYVNYTDTSGDTQITRFSVDPSNPDVALPGSALDILDYNQPFPNHNGGCLAFGQDGYLYISSGDGGSGGDPGNRAQNTTLLLGKMLRIDVDNPSGGNNYGIPTDNPFAGSSVNAQEIWAYGLRNPWKFSFDPANGDMWIGDVGQQNVEEIDRATSTEAGLNYGWRCYEGSDPFNTSNCPPVGDLTFPLAEYSSASGSGNCSITGGYVYRGAEFPNIQGLYFFADYCSGFIGTVDSAGALVEQADFSDNWTSFGVDVDGNLYAVALGGTIYKIIDESPLSIETPDVAFSVTVSPNPASHTIHINIDNGLLSSITIFDVKGSALIQRDVTGASYAQLVTDSLTSGMYMVKIVTEDGTIQYKKLMIR